MAFFCFCFATFLKRSGLKKVELQNLSQHNSPGLSKGAWGERGELTAVLSNQNKARQSYLDPCTRVL